MSARKRRVLEEDQEGLDGAVEASQEQPQTEVAEAEAAFVPSRSTLKVG